METELLLVIYLLLILVVLYELFLRELRVWVEVLRRIVICVFFVRDLAGGVVQKAEFLHEVDFTQGLVLLLRVVLLEGWFFFQAIGLELSLFRIFLGFAGLRAGAFVGKDYF